MPYSVYLKKNEEKRIVAGHPWVFANEVARIEGKDKNGSLATVYDFNGRFIGKGYINHLSKILVRIFIRSDEEDGKELYRCHVRFATSGKIVGQQLLRISYKHPRRPHESIVHMENTMHQTLQYTLPRQAVGLGTLSALIAILAIDLFSAIFTQYHLFIFCRKGTKIQ